VDHCLVRAITEILIEIEVFIKTNGDPVQLFDVFLFSMPADPTELELEFIQTQMAQNPMLRAEVGMRVRCANKASAE
jgi:hypothetical protein